MNAEATSYEFHETDEHLVQSRIVAQTFKIKVWQPMSRTDKSERFPVVYMTDSDDFFGGIAAMANILQGHGEAPRFILVGIGYENPRAAVMLRWRDLVTHAIRARYLPIIEPVVDSRLFSGGVDLKTVAQTTDAREFLRFIREELMPLVAARYPVIPGDSNYCGYSAGGTFGLYTLFTQPGTFKRYILGSPGTSYGGDHFAMELVRAFIKSGQKMDAKVFMSVGELEELKRGYGRLDMVTGCYILAKFLEESAIPGLDLTVRMFPGETHATAWTLAFNHGLKSVFGPVTQVPYWPDDVK